MNANELKAMSGTEVVDYVRKLEEQTGTHPKTDAELNEMGYWEVEDYVAELEKEKGFQSLPES